MSSETIRKRLAERCPGRWETTGDQLNGGTGVVATDRANGDLQVCETSSGADSDLIAHAPTDLALALNVIAVMQVYHGHPKWVLTSQMKDPYDCKCGRAGCRELAALDAFEAAP